MIKFKKIKYKNFFSVGEHPIEIDLNRSQTTGMIGLNGASKSAMVDSIHFALFGSAFRDITKAEIINSINGRGTVVELEFSVFNKDYKIVRGIKPDIFEIYENGKLLESVGAREDQASLQKNILQNLNERTFRQVIGISSTNYNPFMRMSTPERRMFVEDFLDLSIFSSMKENLKTKVTENLNNLKTNEYDLKLVVDKIRLEQDYIAKQTLQQNSNKQEYQDKIDDLKKTINEIEAKITLKQTELDKEKLLLVSNSYDKELQDMRKLYNQLEFSIKGHQETINFFHKNDDCPTCKQTIDLLFKNNIVTEKTTKISDIKVGLGTLSQKIKDKELQIKEYDIIKTKVNSLSSDISMLNFEVNTHKKSITSLENKLKDFDNIIIDNTKLAEYEVDKSNLETKNKELKIEKDYNDALDIMLKDNGIKSKIIKYYMPIINKTINEYLEKFGFPVQFILDENFKETINARYRDKLSYSNFSEGERRRIDIAILLAWRSLVKQIASLDTNLLIFDETLTTNLDYEGVTEVLRVLTDEFKSDNIFIISHSFGDEVNDKLRSIIKFEKEEILVMSFNTQLEKTMFIWKFDEAPPVLQELSEFGGDEDYIMMVHESQLEGTSGNPPSWVEKLSNYEYKKYNVPDEQGWIAYITAHA